MKEGKNLMRHDECFCFQIFWKLFISSLLKQFKILEVERLEIFYFYLIFSEMWKGKLENA
jgi:hypothetical protein